MKRVGVTGAAGRMGRAVVRLLAGAGLQLGAAWERVGHPDLGADAGSLAGLAAAGVTLQVFSDRALEGVDVVIDFSSPESTLGLARRAENGRAALVVGTTGLASETTDLLRERSRQVPVLVASNFSTGLNVLRVLVRQAAAALGAAYDIEIVEAHHRLKKDAPSGTALTLYEEACRGRGLDPAQAACYGRQGMPGPRKTDEIGLHAVRGGDIVGDHTVLLAGPGERLELKHQVHTRDTLAVGAVRAAAWLAGRPAGWYSVADVLGLPA